MELKQYKVTITISMLVHATDTNDATTKARDTLEDEWFEVEDVDVKEWEKG